MQAGETAGSSIPLRIYCDDEDLGEYKCSSVPRIDERIVLTFGVGGQPVVDHYYQVTDVEYRLDNKIPYQIAIRVRENANAEPW